MPLIPATTEQLVVVLTADWAATSGTLQRWEREPGGAWRAVSTPDPTVVGKGGLGWGRGLHPSGLGGPTKAEGDGRAPAGVFALGTAMGVAAVPPAGTRFPYTPTTGQLCVDDPASRHYNTLIPAASTPKDWGSAETMVRKDALYDWLVVVRHNDPPHPGAGSCIFLHVWRAAEKPTVGCTAGPAPLLTTLITWLDPAAAPLLVQLPAAEYAARREAWGLP